MAILKLFRVIPNPGQLVPVGVLTVSSSGDLYPDTEDLDLKRFLKTLKVTASMRGEPVGPSDPNFALAVADSIGRESVWHYVASLE